MRIWLLALLLSYGLAAGADERVSVCYNYGCLTQADIVYSERQLEEIADMLALAGSAEQERALLAQAVGRLYAWAGEQSPVKSDRGGNYPDEGVDGRMDCIDHSTSTTRLLKMLERRGWLYWHRVLEAQRRLRVLVFQHFSAVIEELPMPRRVAAPAPTEMPDYVPVMLALCDCNVILDDMPRPVVQAPVVGKGTEPERYVVDSWFVDNGRAAVVMPLATWLEGDGPDVE